MTDRDVLQIVCIDCGGPVEAGKNRCAMHLRRTPDRAVVTLSMSQEQASLLEYLVREETERKPQYEHQFRHHWRVQELHAVILNQLEKKTVSEINQVSRFTSDCAVNCRKCGEPLGYVAANGHAEWEHVVCSEAKVRAVFPAIERAYAAYDSDPRVNGPDDYEAFVDAVMGVLNA